MYKLNMNLLFSFQNIPIPINGNNSLHQICVCFQNQTEPVAVIVLLISTSAFISVILHRV